MNGKKYAVIAVALFLVLGVGSAVFADYDGDKPSIDQTESSGNLGEPIEPKVTVDENVKNNVVPPSTVDDNLDENTGILVIPSGDDNNSSTNSSVTSPVRVPSKPVVLPSDDKNNENLDNKPDDSQNNNDANVSGSEDNNGEEDNNSTDRPTDGGGNQGGGSTTPGNPNDGGGSVTKPTEEEIVKNINNEIDKISDLNDVEEIKKRLEEINKDISGVSEEKKKELDNDLTLKLDEVLKNEIDKAAQSGDVDAVKEIRDILNERLETITDDDIRKEIEDNLKWLSKGIDGTPVIVANVSGKVSGNTNYTTQDSVSVAIPDIDNIVMIKLNGKEVKVDDLKNITKEGSYTIRITDKDGIENVIGFVIDRTAPILSLKAVSFTSNTILVDVSEILSDINVLDAVSFGRTSTNPRRFEIKYDDLVNRVGAFSVISLVDYSGNTSYYNVIASDGVITCEALSASDYMLLIGKDATKIVNE